MNSPRAALPSKNLTSSTQTIVDRAEVVESLKRVLESHLTLVV